MLNQQLQDYQVQIAHKAMQLHGTIKANSNHQCAGFFFVLK
jgi:hypothetical protein